MRLDHIAYRVRDRHKTTKFFIEAFSYRIQQEFTIDFGEGHTAQCVALEPPEKPKAPHLDRQFLIPWIAGAVPEGAEYHLPPEIFVSDGNPGSIVGDWVMARGGIGGVHHIAYQVDDVDKTMKLWQEKGYAEFSSEEPMKCPGLVQVFTKPSELTGVIYEFIKREEFGFCKDNVKSLMLSTQGL